MATWCVFNSMFQRLTSSKHVLDTYIKTSIQSHKFHRVLGMMDLGGNYIGDLQSRAIHVTSSYTGTRLPSGVPQRRKPLKITKGIRLDRVQVHHNMTIKQLAVAMNKPTDHIYEVLLMIPDTDCYDHNQSVLDMKTIMDVVKKSGMIPEFTKKKIKEDKNGDIVPQPPPDASVLVKRSPIVTIMGHVDHGKTTLLDQLRNSNIVEKEFGGITQHIGAFRVTLNSGDSICFLDTPGHAAFSAMRARGADLTDIIVLVVAADDGVMQQTIESIQLAQDARVPVIVAINKIDKQNANVERTKQMLMEHQIHLEEFGGDVQVVPISALKAVNMLELQEAIVLQAELMNLQSDPVGLVEGRIVEARVDDKRGRLVTAVVQRGTLRRGDHLISGTVWAKVRAMFDDTGNPVQEAPPGTPVEILGWKDTPSAGDEFLQVREESELKRVLAWRLQQKLKMKQDEDYVAIASERSEHEREHKAALMSRRQQGFYRAQPIGQRKKEILHDDSDVPQYALVLKGDVDGSVDALLDAFDTYKCKKCQLDIIHFGVGSVTESDVDLAATFNGDVYAFNVQVAEKVAALAKEKHVSIKKHNIIYRLFEDLVASMNKKLPTIQEEVIAGESKVLQVFQITLPNKKKSYVAGCRCTSGSISKKLKVKVLRDEVVVYEGNITSLKSFKTEVDIIKKEGEFGLCLDNTDFVFQAQDVIRCVNFTDIVQEIDWDPGF